MQPTLALPIELDFYKTCVDSQTIVLVTNAEGTILYVNETFSKTFGYSLEEVQGKNPNILKSGEHSAEWYAAMWAQIKRGEIRRHEICDRTKDGKRIWLNVSLVPHIGALGVPDYFVSVSYDISEYKRLQLEFEAERERALAAVRAKSDFYARMTHEIRTPMNAMLGVADLLVGTPMSPENAEYVSILSSSGRVLLALINDVLDHAKIEAGGISLENKPVLLQELANNVVALFSHSAQQKGNALKLELDNLLPKQIFADSLRITQVLSNIIANAVKFTQNGEIVLTINRKGEKNGKVSVEFAIHDTGVGMTTEQQERLFMAYSQADASVSRTHGGTGLGLTISQKLVELMGGELKVESAIGVGSRFFFEADFDVVRTSNTEVPPKASGIEQSLSLFPLELRSKRIAVAEDNPANIKLMSAALRRMGFSPSLAENGVALLELMNTASFDLVLLDEQMPLMTGGESARKIIERMGASHPPMILVTANTVAEMGDAFNPDLFDGVLTKPIDFASLRQTILTNLTKDKNNFNTPKPKPNTSAVPTSIGERILELRSELMDDEFVCHFLETFLQSSSKTVSQLLAIKCDDETLSKKRPAHALAGSSLNVGAKDLAAYSSMLEKAATESESAWSNTYNSEKLKNLWNETVKAIETVIAELKRNIKT